MCSRHDRRQHARTACRGEHDVAHHAIRLQACCLGDLDQQPFLAVDPLDLVGERLDHPLLGLAADLVDDLDQQVDQPVGELALPVRQEQRIEGMAPAVRMPAHGPGGLVDHTTPEAFARRDRSNQETRPRAAPVASRRQVASQR